MLHYVFMESWSNPRTDPVAMWMNGGPGSSSMGGLFTELGPFATSDLSFPHGPTTGPYTVQLNNYSWNSKASMIYLEQPAGVGFSYCNKTTNPSCNFSDESQAEDTYAFLVKFFDGFPEYASNELFLTAESYGGVYVPTLAHDLITRPNKLNCKGIAIGNPTFRQTGWNYPSQPGQPAPILSPREQVHSEFFFGHGQYSADTHRKLNAACDWEAAAQGRKPSTACKGMIDQMSEEIGGYNVYNIYDQCKLAGDNLKLRTFRDWEELLGGNRDEFTFSILSSGGGVSEVSTESRTDFGYLCGAERGEVAYLNQPAVRTALHICSMQDCGEFPGHHDDWTAPYNRTEYDEALLYREFIAHGLRVMIYSGGTDACIPYSGTEEWISALKLPAVETWRPWTIDNATRMAGYVTTYNHLAGTPSSFLFVTIRGAGHMVGLSAALPIK